MRGTLRRLLGQGARLQSSYLPGRSGFVITTTRPLAQLRQALMPRWAARLYPLHRESGRLFLEPTSRFLVLALRRDRLELWWTPAHQEASTKFFSSVRAERIRRLPSSSGHTRHWVRGFKGLRSLALRLESLHATPKPDKHWRGLAEAFDDLWADQKLYAVPSSALQVAVFSHLRRCHERHDLLAQAFRLVDDAYPRP